MRRSGSADLPLHYGSVPMWLLERMSRLSLAITEAVITEYGKKEFLSRMSDPFWFQSFGAVLGMDWHSSGITTSVMGVMKRVINPVSKQLGIHVCGGKGNASRKTPVELLAVGDKTGLNGNELVRASKLSAKVDNNALQDGYQLYLHNFIVSSDGDWTVIQQGMNEVTRTARRYHWHSEGIRSFIDSPHTGIYGKNHGIILNLTDVNAAPARNAILEFTKENPESVIKEFNKLILPGHHDVQAADVNMKRLGAVLWLAKEKEPKDFEELLLLEGTGPRTIQSLALVSEVIHGTASRFKDPARFSFAHGGKDGHPFPVPLQTYDETIAILENAVHRAKIGLTDKNEAIKKLHSIAGQAEQHFTPSTEAEAEALNTVIEEERRQSWKYSGRTVMGKSKKPSLPPSGQLSLFD